MKVLVTGGAGFIGNKVVRLMEQLGHQCHVIDNRTTYGVIPVDEINYLIETRQKGIASVFHRGDIVNAPLVDSMFKNVKPDVVIHLASFPRQKVVNSNPRVASEVMNTGLINLLEGAKASGVSRFVYISSSMVYGDFSDNVKEDAVCNPQGQYGIMKLAGEWLVKDYSRRGCFEHVIIRPSAVYGELDVEDRVVSKFMMAAMRNQPLKVNGATEALDFTYVEDTAMGITLASVLDQAKNKTYNITRGRSRTLFNAAKLIINIAGGGSLNIREKDIDFPSRGALNIDAARQDLGYNPLVDIEEGFKFYYDWLSNDSFFRNKSSI